MLKPDISRLGDPNLYRHTAFPDLPTPDQFDIDSFDLALNEIPSEAPPESTVSEPLETSPPGKRAGAARFFCYTSPVWFALALGFPEFITWILAFVAAVFTIAWALDGLEKIRRTRLHLPKSPSKTGRDYEFDRNYAEFRKAWMKCMVENLKHRKNYLAEQTIPTAEFSHQLDVFKGGLDSLLIVSRLGTEHGCEIDKFRKWLNEIERRQLEVDTINGRLPETLVLTPTSNVPPELLTNAWRHVSIRPSRPVRPNTTNSSRARFAYRQKVGEAGEELVLKLEKFRLRTAGRRDLAEQVVQISRIDSSAGFDISSRTRQGAEIFIEVKATLRSETPTTFYLTQNEFNFLASHPDNSFLFIVRLSNDLSRIEELTVLGSEQARNLAREAYSYRITLPTDADQA